MQKYEISFFFYYIIHSYNVYKINLYQTLINIKLITKNIENSNSQITNKKMKSRLQNEFSYSVPTLWRIRISDKLNTYASLPRFKNQVKSFIFVNIANLYIFN